MVKRKKKVGKRVVVKMLIKDFKEIVRRKGKVKKSKVKKFIGKGFIKDFKRALR